jgi:hypothetical protein
MDGPDKPGHDGGGLVSRDLQIALVSAALVIVMTYGLWNVIKTGETMLVLTRIRRAEAPQDFWGVVGIAAVCIAGLATLSIPSVQLDC